MSHVAKVIEIPYRVARYDSKGVKDRRFRTGYRILPESGTNLLIDYILVDFMEQHKVHQIWNVGKFDTIDDLGKFCVVMINGISKVTKLVPVSNFQNKDKLGFVFKPELDLLFMGNYYLEGQN